MFGTRIQTDLATHHIANRMMSEVTNHSQLGVVTTLDIGHHIDHEVVRAATAQAQASRPEMPAIVVDRVEAISESVEAASRIHLRTVRTLGDTDQHHFNQHLLELISAEGAPDDQPPATDAAQSTK